MTEVEFNQQIDELLLNIEEQLDELEVDADIDYDNQNGILDIVIDEKSHLIINRQASHRQLWLAAPSGGYHFEYNDGKWLDTKTQTSFVDMLNNCLTDLCGEKIRLTA